MKKKLYSLLLYLLRAVGLSFGFLAALCGLIWLPVAWDYFVASPRYAKTYFSGAVEYEEVLASQGTHYGPHPEFGWFYGCRFAIVQLPINASPIPPQKWRRDWEETPVTLEVGQMPVLTPCQYNWDKELTEILWRIRNSPGHYYYLVDWENLYLYSATERIAAHIRFGD